MVEIKRPIFMCGENPGMTLYIPGTEQAAAIASYWHCTDSPHGVGHALILWLAEGRVPVSKGFVLTDNPDLSQLLVTRLTRYLPEFEDAPIEKLDYRRAHCEHTFAGSCYQVICEAPDRQVKIEWRNPLDRKQILWPRFPAGDAVYDLTTVICPCRAGSIWINNKELDGEVKVIQKTDGTFSSTAFLAFAETWVGPVEV